MKVVLTGGPSAGKTSIAQFLLRTFMDQVVPVPETATMLYRCGFSRFRSAACIAKQQEAIYRVQVLHEEILAMENPGKLLVCDRGTLDGVAYWDHPEHDFFTQLATSPEIELARYDQVWFLEPAPEAQYDRSNNPVRRENYLEAVASSQRLKKIWEGHPQFKVISNGTDFFSKMQAAKQLVEGLLID